MNAIALLEQISGRKYIPLDMPVQNLGNDFEHYFQYADEIPATLLKDAFKTIRRKKFTIPESLEEINSLCENHLGYSLANRLEMTFALNLRTFKNAFTDFSSIEDFHIAKKN